jgi:hypothetical protein
MAMRVQILVSWVIILFRLYVIIDVSEEYDVSSFRVEDLGNAYKTRSCRNTEDQNFDSVQWFT